MNWDEADFRERLDALPRRKHREHPAMVTADRLHAHLERWPDKFDGQMRDHISHVIDHLERIAEGRL